MALPDLKAIEQIDYQFGTVRHGVVLFWNRVRVHPVAGKVEPEMRKTVAEPAGNIIPIFSTSKETVKIQNYRSVLVGCQRMLEYRLGEHGLEAVNSFGHRLDYITTVGATLLRIDDSFDDHRSA